jgi:hypothetical protein
MYFKLTLNIHVYSNNIELVGSAVMLLVFFFGGGAFDFRVGQLVVLS